MDARYAPVWMPEVFALSSEATFHWQSQGQREKVCFPRLLHAGISSGEFERRCLQEAYIVCPV